MFALPEAKRVRRKDLYDSDSDSDSDSASDGDSESEGGNHNSQVADTALRAKLHAQLSELFDFNFTPAAAAATGQAEGEGGKKNPEPAEEEKKEEDVYAFRLFHDEAPTRTIVLTHDPDLTSGEGGSFVIASRPRSHYIADPPSPSKESEYRSVAVNASDLFADARRRRCWGLEKPWRVMHIGTSKPASMGEDGKGKKEEKGKRKRPGKKHRILLRVREKKVKEREEVNKLKTLEKEEHLQEKKKRLNRERKLKRRQKEREKKAEVRGQDPRSGGVGDGDDDDGDEPMNSGE